MTIDLFINLRFLCVLWLKKNKMDKINLVDLCKKAGFNRFGVQEIFDKEKNYIRKIYKRFEVPEDVLLYYRGLPPEGIELFLFPNKEYLKEQGDFYSEQDRIDDSFQYFCLPNNARIELAAQKMRGILQLGIDVTIEGKVPVFYKPKIGKGNIRITELPPDKFGEEALEILLAYVEFANKK